MFYFFYFLETDCHEQINFVEVNTICYLKISYVV